MASSSLFQLGTDVAREFGLGFSCSQKYEHIVTINKPGNDKQWGINLILRSYETKIEVVGKYPKDNDGNEITLNVDRPSINISADRVISSIVADIKRRFLPSYSELYNKHIDVMVKRNEYIATRDIMVNKFINITGGTVAKNNDRINVRYRKDGGYINDLYLNATDQTVSMDLRSVPADVAEQILKLLV